MDQDPAPPGLADLHWQAGHGAFPVSQSNMAVVQEYITNREQHHRKMTFQEKLSALPARRQIEFDERYVWD